MRIVKFMETEGRMVVPRGCGAGRIRELLFSGHKVSACKRKCSDDWLWLQNNRNVFNALELYTKKNGYNENITAHLLGWLLSKNER